MISNNSFDRIAVYDLLNAETLILIIYHRYVLLKLVHLNHVTNMREVYVMGIAENQLEKWDS